MIYDKPSIDCFDGEFDFLSNMYPCTFVCDDDIEWKSSEHYYQAQKTTNNADFERVRNADTGQRVKRMVSSMDKIASWNTKKFVVMKKALYFKFTQNLDISKKLMLTQGSELIEGNWWNDTYWGVCGGIGQNMLGILLMSLRDDLIGEDFVLVRNDNG